MSVHSVAMDVRCDLLRLERTNMVSKMEDRIKVELEQWGRLILDQLRLCDLNTLASTPATIERIAVQFNQGALLQYQYGEIERAKKLCHAQIELFAQLSSFSANRALCLAKVITPYINLARIYGQKGQVQESLGILEDVYRFGVENQDLSIFGHRITVADRTAMLAAEPVLQKLMLSSRVVEATRVLQIMEDYPALLALTEANEALPEYQNAFFKQYLLEARSRALLHMRQYEMALQALEDCCRQMPLNTPDRIVIHILLSQIYREWGREELVRETLSRLEQHLGGVEKFGRRLPVLRQIAYRLALEYHLLGDHAKALGPAEKSFKWCSEWGDQPGAIKSAILLSRICNDEDASAHAHEMQRHWYDELQKLASTTFFRLDRACAYWELGLSSINDTAPESACQFLQNSYNLYCSVPFVDSQLSGEAVKQALNARGWGLPACARLQNGIERVTSPLVDSVYDALMEFLPNACLVT